VHQRGILLSYTRSRIALAFLLLSASALAMPAWAQDVGAAGADSIIVTAQRQNQTGVTHSGSIGVLGAKAAEDVPFAIKSYNAALILNQQPQTLGQVLDNDPSIRTSYGFGNAAEQFVIRGFALAGDDIGFDGLYGITPRQLIAPELYESVQVLNGSSAFLNGASPGGTGIGGSVNLIPKRAAETPLTRITANYTSSAHVGGSFDVSRRLGANGEWGVRVNGAARRGDVAIEEEFRSAYLLGGAIDYTSGPLRLSLDLAYQKVRVNGLRPKLTLPAAITMIPRVPEADTNYGQPFNFTNLRDVYGQFRAEYDLSDDAVVYAAFGARDGSEDGYYGTFTPERHHRRHLGVRVTDPADRQQRGGAGGTARQPCRSRDHPRDQLRRVDELAGQPQRLRVLPGIVGNEQYLRASHRAAAQSAELAAWRQHGGTVPRLAHSAAKHVCLGYNRAAG
jgi:iron complex outermembrane receptor protein